MAIVQRELRYPTLVHRRTHRRFDRVGAVGTLTLVLVAFWLCYSIIGLASSWIAVKVDDVRYGYPRTYQTDGYVGFREAGGLPTHFTVINAHRQIVVLIMPGTDPARVTVIKGPYLFGPGQEFSPATLTLEDANRDGHPDIELHVAGQTLTYLNDPLKHTFIVPRAIPGGSR